MRGEGCWIIQVRDEDGLDLDGGHGDGEKRMHLSYQKEALHDLVIG